MRKSLLSAGLLSLVLLASCSDSSKKPAEEKSSSMPIEFMTYNYDLVGHADSIGAAADSLANWHFKGNGVMPAKIGSHDITLLRDSLMSLAAVTFSKDNKPSPRLEPGISLTDKNPATTPMPNGRVASLSIDLITSTLIVWENYCFEMEAFMAHGIATTDYVNYSIADNKILSLADIMKPGYEAPLLSMIREELTNKEVRLIEEDGEFPLPEMFRIRATGIEFVYPTMSIAAYSEGNIRVRLSVMDLQDILTEKGKQLILGTQGEQ
ncbi:MAG: DUF3298 domain-containing protein [Bacteroidales bacterium]|nr:DUF3298 domain-containing protein [Bacteroidales bacterium]